MRVNFQTHRKAEPATEWANAKKKKTGANTSGAYINGRVRGQRVISTWISWRRRKRTQKQSVCFLRVAAYSVPFLTNKSHRVDCVLLDFTPPVDKYLWRHLRERVTHAPLSALQFLHLSLSFTHAFSYFSFLLLMLFSIFKSKCRFVRLLPHHMVVSFCFKILKQ